MDFYFLFYINDFVSNIFVGDDGKLHKVQGGADTVLPFSSLDYKEIYVGYGTNTCANAVYNKTTGQFYWKNSGGQSYTSEYFRVSTNNYNQNVTANKTGTYLIFAARRTSSGVTNRDVGFRTVNAGTNLIASASGEGEFSCAVAF